MRIGRGVIPVLTVSWAMFFAVPVFAASRDCDANAVIYCGAMDKAELVRKLQQGDGKHSASDLQAIMTSYGITVAEINSGDTQEGTVRKDGSVWVGSKKVADGAISTGRVDMPGSTRRGNLYERPTSVSFRSESLPAFVYMPNGRFEWAIIKSCGNPVKARAAEVTVSTTPTPTPPPPKPTPPPPAPAPLPQTGSLPAGAISLLAVPAAVTLHGVSRRRLVEVLNAT
jgi:hypothetical protein